LNCHDSKYRDPGRENLKGESRESDHVPVRRRTSKFGREFSDKVGRTHRVPAAAAGGGGDPTGVTVGLRFKQS
jgi:hypothetical protein